jgi:hypothetical protein
MRSLTIINQRASWICPVDALEEIIWNKMPQATQKPCPETKPFQKVKAAYIQFCIGHVFSFNFQFPATRYNNILV